MAADPVEVDAKHYKVEFENDRVRVFRVSYGPGERSVCTLIRPWLRFR
jgi:hypothetical protein